MKKMKIMSLLFFAIALAGLCGCENNRAQYLDEYSLRVCFRNGGEQEITLYSVGENTVYEIPVCKGGSDIHATVNTRIAVMDQSQLDIYNMSERTAYRQISSDCFAFQTPTEMTFGDGELSKVVRVEMKTDRIRTLQEAVGDDATYVLALQLYADGPVSADINRLILVPTIEIPTVSFISDLEKVFYTTDDPQQNSKPVTLQLDMDNRWDFTCTVEALGQEWLDEYNETNETEYELLTPDQYTLTPEVQFTTGTNTADIALTVERTDFEPFVDYVLPLHLTHCSKPELQIDPETTYLLVMRLNPSTSPVTLREAMLNVPENFTQSNDGGGVPALVDGKTDTYWHSNYNSNVETDETYGVYIDINLESPLNVVQFTYSTRHNNNNGVPTRICIGVRNSDEEEWELIGVATEGLTEEAGGSTELPVFFRREQFKQVRFGIAASKLGTLTGNTNGASTALGELSLKGATL